MPYKQIFFFSVAYFKKEQKSQIKPNLFEVVLFIFYSRPP